MQSEKRIQELTKGPATRIKALLAGQQVDRVPFWLWFASSSIAARNVGYTVTTTYRDQERSFWAQLQTIEMYGNDNIPTQAITGSSDGTLAFGGKIKWPIGDELSPSQIHYPVESEEDAEKLELPRDVKTAGPVPLYMQFSKLQQRFGLPITLWVTSPIEEVESICGMMTLCRWLVRKPELVHRLLRLVTDYSVKVVQYWADTFAPQHILVYNSNTASNQIVSPKQFETFVLPYQRELHEKILATGIKHICCHICGEHNRNLPYWGQIPMGNPGIVTFGQEVDLNTAIRHFGDTCIIAGNIEPAIIQRGTADQVYNLSRECIEKAKHSPRGFILAPGCTLPHMAPPYNVFMMKKAVCDFGSYK